ncbi:MAG: helix-turn-helix transcriptional regulator [Bacteroidales bacterium]|nr:helix-turn-helix transcriptional regulator [Bacteroidales bacterium]
MNQKELGAMLGVGQTTVSAWETGKNEPDNESMHKMAKFFRVSIGYLMGYESDPDTGLTLAEREQYNEANAEAARRKHEEQVAEQLSRYYVDPEDPELADMEYYAELEEWQKTDQTTYFEFFKLNKLGDYLTKEQRQRILDVAKVMFPNAEKGLYTDETTRK